MSRKTPAPHSMRGGYRFSEKDMRQSKILHGALCPLCRLSPPAVDPVHPLSPWSMIVMNEPLVVAGASSGGLQIALAARGAGFESPILLVGDEPHLPYQRPPLSKGFLTGKVAQSAL